MAKVLVQAFADKDARSQIPLQIGEFECKLQTAFLRITVSIPTEAGYMIRQEHVITLPQVISPITPNATTPPMIQQQNVSAFSPRSPAHILPPSTHSNRDYFPALKVCRKQGCDCKVIHGEMDPNQVKYWSTVDPQIQNRVHGQMCLHHFKGNCLKGEKCIYFHFKDKVTLTPAQQRELRLLEQSFQHKPKALRSPAPQANYSLFSHPIQ